MKLKFLLDRSSNYYANTPLHQELPSASEYFDTTGEMIYLNMRASKVYAGVLEKLKRDDKVNLKG